VSRGTRQCGYDLGGQRCTAVGDHLCVPRYTRAVEFFRDILVHTKGRWARKPFVLTGWQRDEIVVPTFGPAVWSDELGAYRRLVTDLRVEMARKNGKSELAAGIALLLLVADDEEAPEVYSCARDRDQARKVYDVAERMVLLSPVLRHRLKVVTSAKRIVDERMGGWYEVIASDAAGNLGHNPHGVVLDEELTQPDGDLWAALKSAQGARAQPLYVRATTATNDPASWSHQEHEEALRVAEDPLRAPHRRSVIYSTPAGADPWDETQWPAANPALGDFLSIDAIRRDALEAASSPSKENAFRQYRLNQHVQQVTRWMTSGVWDQCVGPVGKWGPTYPAVLREKLAGMRCYAGLDLAATTDLAAWCLLFDPPEPGGPCPVLWRFWTPEAQIPFLDSKTGGRASVWAREGWLAATEGDWIDYEGAIHPQIRADADAFCIVEVGYDQREATATAQYMDRLGLTVTPVTQGYGLSGALKELMRMVKAGQLAHGGDPVARWCADCVEVRRDDLDRIKVVKPLRERSGKRIDGVAALANAIHVRLAGSSGTHELSGALMA